MRKNFGLKFNFFLNISPIFSYSLFHATRKTFSNVKSTITDEWLPSCDENDHVCVPLKPDER